MGSQPKTLKDEDEIEDALSIMQKYNLIGMPVIDDEAKLIGVVSLNDSIYEYTRLRRAII